jgi:hypothetical protein
LTEHTEFESQTGKDTEKQAEEGRMKMMVVVMIKNKKKKRRRRRLIKI